MSDALGVLRTSVGAAQCLSCVCDLNGNGSKSVTGALLALRIAVGLGDRNASGEPHEFHACLLALRAHSRPRSTPFAQAEEACTAYHTVFSASYRRRCSFFVTRIAAQAALSLQ